MRVFVAGATGALGRPLVRQLLQRGHRVVGLTSYRPEVVRELGAEPAVANVLEATALRKTVADAKPDAVIHVLTRIPKTAIPTPGRFKVNDQIRREGTRNLIEASRGAGVETFLGESITFAFRGRSEENMKPFERMGAFQKTLDAAVSLEKQTLAYPGIVLRYAYFYGPGTTFNNEIPKALRRRMMAIIGKGRGWMSFIHVEDAASGTIAALERGRPGETYNICDDDPILAVDAMSIVAEANKAAKPLRLPGLAPSWVRMYFNDGTGAANTKAKNELGWHPSYPNFREGYPRSVRE